MTEHRKNMIIVALVAALVSVLSFLALFFEPGTQAIRGGTNQKIVSNIQGTRIDVLSGGTIDINTGGTLSANSQAFSGAIKFGSTASVADGASITHGFSVTPTTCVASPNWLSGAAVTATVSTITTTGFAVKTSGTITITWFCGK